ncbi:MAG: hypothetical protein ACTHKF_06105, partial [Candidatus Nitrosocosmicus sp.]
MTQKINNNNDKINHNPFWTINYAYILILLLIFSAITLIVTNGLGKYFDSPIFNYFINIPRNPQSDIIIITITTVSDTINLIIIGFILTIIKKTRPFGLILLISIVVITIVITYVKPLFAVNQT